MSLLSTECQEKVDVRMARKLYRYQPIPTSGDDRLSQLQNG